MATKTNLSKVLAVSVIFLVMAGVTFAEPLLSPMHRGLGFVYKETKADSIRYIVGEFTEKLNLNSMDYYLLESWELDSGDLPEPVDLVRSTETGVYSYSPAGDLLQFQKARVGTTWTLYEPHSSGLNYKVIEIVAIEQVTVPYGTFNKAYKHRRYRCADPADLSQGYSPDWYEWIVPGVGVVKKVDYWGEFEIEELVSAYSELEDNMAATLAFFDESLSSGTLEGIGKGKGKKQLGDLRRTLETALGLIEDGYNGQACEQLFDAYAGCDGEPATPDMVAGDAAADLAEMIHGVIDGLDCE